MQALQVQARALADGARTVADGTGSGVAEVEVTVTRKGKRVVRGAATVDGDRWTLRLPKLKRGTYRLRITATDRAGNAKLLRKTLRLR